MAPVSEAPRFHEIRYFKRGPVAQFFAIIGLLLLVAAVFVEWYRPAFVAGGLLLFVPFLLRFETTVDARHLSTQVRPFWRRTIALSDLVATEVTIWDGQVGFFGGFSARDSLAGALISSWEGDSSVGNRAVVLELRSGRRHQVGTFQPKRLIEVLEAATGRTLLEQ